MLEYTQKNIIEVRDWDELVVKTYNRPYSFQQQYDCQERGLFHLTIPSLDTEEDEMYDDIPEIINGDKMGVKFETWLNRDPKQPLATQEHRYQLDLFYYRNFYPSIYTVANDLYEKGLVKKGDYIINIDW